jgi:exosortase family protein XrtF
MAFYVVNRIKSLDFWQLFLLKLIVIYLVLHLGQLYFNESFIGMAVNAWISNAIAEGTVMMMRLFSVPASFVEMGHGAQLFVDGQQSVYIDHSCNAFNILKAFLALVWATSFRNKHLVWFLPIGVLSIFLVNIVRVWALAFVYKNAPEMLDINHKYVFTIVVYGWIFLLFLMWVNVFVKPNMEKA